MFSIPSSTAFKSSNSSTKHCRSGMTSKVRSGQPGASYTNGSTSTVRKSPTLQTSKSYTAGSCRERYGR